MLEQQANGYGGQGQKLSGAGKSGVAVAPHRESTVQEMGVSGGLLASLGEAGEEEAWSVLWAGLPGSALSGESRNRKDAHYLHEIT